jgi:hypothetical protein
MWIHSVSDKTGHIVELQVITVNLDVLHVMQYTSITHK